MNDQNKHCPSCEQTLIGQFCHHCGEKAFVTKDLSFNKVSQHVFTSVTEVDGKLVKSFWLLLSRPGQLTIDYMVGRRKNRLSPFQLLLLVNILFFLVAAFRGNTAFTTNLIYHTNSTNFIHQPIASKLVSDHLATSNESRESFANRFNAVAEIQAKSLVVLMVPMFALLVLLLYLKQPFPVVGSLVFATHLFSYMLIIHALVAPLISKLMAWGVATFSLAVGEGVFEWIYSFLLVLIFGVYFFLASKRVFQPNDWTNGLKTLLYVVTVYWVYLIYRMM